MYNMPNTMLYDGIPLKCDFNYINYSIIQRIRMVCAVRRTPRCAHCAAHGSCAANCRLPNRNCCLTTAMSTVIAVCQQRLLFVKTAIAVCCLCLLFAVCQTANSNLADCCLSNSKQQFGRQPKRFERIRRKQIANLPRNLVQ